MEAGDTFYDGSNNHLWVVISDPVANPDDNVVMVPLNSYIEGTVGHDSTCVLQCGEHPFNKKPTFVNYKWTRWLPRDAAERRVSDKTFLPREKLSVGVLTAIQQGAEVSNHTKGKYRMLLEKQGIIG
jgi:hypothetical protein